MPYGFACTRGACLCLQLHVCVTVCVLRMRGTWLCAVMCAVMCQGADLERALAESRRTISDREAALRRLTADIESLEDELAEERRALEEVGPLPCPAPISPSFPSPCCYPRPLSYFLCPWAVHVVRCPLLCGAHTCLRLAGACISPLPVLACLRGCPWSCSCTCMWLLGDWACGCLVIGHVAAR
jgi:hypothetical protein